LTETLAVFLAQRQRAVQHALGRRADGTRSRQATIDESADSKKRSGKAGARQVRRIIEGVIYIMFGTLQTARAIFAGADGAESTPLMRQVLDYITKEETSAFASTLPSDLCCSTYRLLSALPSSSQLILLPPNLRAYKPYVDLSSPSTTVAPTELKRKLGEWFGSTVETLRKALRTWLESIEHVRLVWALRTWAREYIGSTKQIEDEEKKVMRGVFDEACKERVTTIWRVALEGMKGGFAVRLTEVVKLLADGDSATIGMYLHIHFPVAIP
jgi:conserved oligomeric Golgi complex subunit 1